MTYVHVVDGAIAALEEHCPKYERRADSLGWHDLRDRATRAARGWLEVVEVPRPPDTATDTWDGGAELVAGVPTRTWIARDKTVAELLDTDTEDDLTKISQVITDLGTLLGDVATPGSIRQIIGTTADPASTATLRAVKAKAATDTTVKQMAVTVRGLADLTISLAQLVIDDARASRRVARQVQRLGLVQTGTLDSADVGTDL